ncbi:ATP-binding protein [Helicobacter cynogastricus]|uniref:ATP-binding protein n=1 Tax=Helicobacter cynogastricus TaxID=329937 RepID=UPI000CF16774|nr:ATP-binding protein [Helicobacter cynogastricus]
MSLMPHFQDFLTASHVDETHIFPALACNKEEAQILRHLLKEYLKGQVEVEVRQILEKNVASMSEILEGKVTDSLNAMLISLEHIKRLVSLEWVQEKRIRTQEFSLLELVDSCLSLSPAFFKLLEKGHNEEVPVNTNPYEDHLEYLNDWFSLIDLLYKFQRQKDSCVKKHVHAQIQCLNQQISTRLESTPHPFEIQKFLHKYHLKHAEQILFFALLKNAYTEDYTRIDEGCDFKSLINLPCVDTPIDTSLLSPKAPLLQKGIIDFEEVLDPFSQSVVRQMVRQYFLQDWVLDAISVPNSHPKSGNTLKNILKDSDIFEALEPKLGLEDVVLSQKTRETLEILCRQIDPKLQARLRSWGIIKEARVDARIIFYGPPGTGKTISALALAKSLKKEVLCFDCSKILSMYVGESEKNVRRIFDDYYKIAKQCKTPPILFLDEADQFLSSRTTATSGADKMHNQMQNIFLHQIEKFEGVLIATTNLLETLDTAFSRRFNHKIEFKPPTFAQRVQLWQQYLPAHAPYAGGHTPESLANTLARHSLSGGQIALVVKNTACKVATYPHPTFTLEDFLAEIHKERQGNFEGAKNIGFGV